MSPREVFRRIISALESTGINYMLTGSFASAYYGAPRSTQDIDIIIEATAEQLRKFVGLLPPREYYVDLDAAVDSLVHESMFNVVDFASGWKIDLIIRKSRDFSLEEFRRRRQITVDGLELITASAEDVILSKLEWAKRSQSRRQIEDVAAILRMQRETLDHAYLEHWIERLQLKDEWQQARSQNPR